MKNISSNVYVMFTSSQLPQANDFPTTYVGDTIELPNLCSP